GHTVVLGIDDVEVFARGDGGFNNFAGLFQAPGVSAGSIPDDVEFAFFSGLEHRGAAADLSRAAQLAADQDEVNGFGNVCQYPVGCQLAFEVHVGTECSFVVFGICVNQPVKEDYPYACPLGRQQDIIPSGGVGRGDQQIIDAVANIPHGRRHLFIDVGGVGQIGRASCRERVDIWVGALS